MDFKRVLRTFFINGISFIVNILEKMVKQLDKYDIEDEPEILDESRVVFSFGEFLNKNTEIRVRNELTLASDKDITSPLSTCLHDLQSEITDQKSETPAVKVSPTDLDCPSEEQKLADTFNNSTYNPRSEVTDQKSETPAAVKVSPTDLDCPTEEEQKFAETLNNSTNKYIPASSQVKDSCSESKPGADVVTVKMFQSKFFVARSRGIRKRFQKMIEDLPKSKNAQGDTPSACMSL